MPYSNPVSFEVATALVGLDYVLNSLVEDFNEIPWLSERVWRRAYTDTFPNLKGDEMTYPQVYIGLGEYYNASINDNFPCSVFFQAKGSEKIAFTKPRDRRRMTNTRQVAMVFWCKLTALAEEFSADYIYTEPMKTIFLQKIAQNSNVVSIEQVFDEPMEDVFDGFSFAEGKQYNKYPFAGIRINFTVQYNTPVYPCEIS